MKQNAKKSGFDGERQKVGLALGAGSARGLAHLGVLQVLQEHSIPIDVIAGSSMGAVAGGIYACGTNVDLLAKMATILNEREYFDIVVPRNGGFIKGEKFKELIRVLTKNYDFSQTRIPFACVAVDVDNGDLLELCEGNLAEAIRASISIPGIFEPQRLNGRLLMDGGVLSRVPIQTAKKLGADIVIGVDVGYRGGRDPRRSNKPLDVLFSATDIMGWQIAQQFENEADLMIVPKVRHIDPNSFAQGEECIELGRQAALAVIDEIERLTAVVEPEEEEIAPVQIA